MSFISKFFCTTNSRHDTIINALDTFVNSWYSQMLYALKEPIIYNYKGDKVIYRFTWLRTFHHRVIVKFEKQNNIIRLVSKVADGAGGYSPGNFFLDTTLDVSVSEWEAFTKVIVDANFWQMPTQNKKYGGKDGSEWIIEAIKDNEYHMAIRWTPTKDEEGEFRKVGETLILMSKIKDETKDDY